MIWKRIDFEGHNSDHFLTYQVNVYDDQGNLAANDLLYHNSSSPYSEVNLDNYLYTWINNLTPGRFYNASVQVAVCFCFEILQERSTVEILLMSFDFFLHYLIKIIQTLIHCFVNYRVSVS